MKKRALALYIACLYMFTPLLSLSETLSTPTDLQEVASAVPSEQPALTPTITAETSPTLVEPENIPFTEQPTFLTPDFASTPASTPEPTPSIAAEIIQAPAETILFTPAYYQLRPGKKIYRSRSMQESDILAEEAFVYAFELEQTADGQIFKIYYGQQGIKTGYIFSQDAGVPMDDTRVNQLLKQAQNALYTLAGKRDLHLGDVCFADKQASDSQMTEPDAVCQETTMPDLDQLLPLLPSASPTASQDALLSSTETEHITQDVMPDSSLLDIQTTPRQQHLHL